MKKPFLFFLFLFSITCVYSQNVQFVQVTDLHVGSGTGAEDLQRTVDDINKNPQIEFVIFTGDITEFGSDEEIKLAKQILDGLKKKWYIIPGNHDTNWSESGNYTFQQIFGGESFYFRHDGIHFIGTSSGPYMRMSPGQVPRENLVWLDSLLPQIPINDRIVFYNHYPIDDGLNNWYEILDRFKKRNVIFMGCGHGHNNRVLNYEGIKGIMARSNLRAKDSTGGYNIVRITADSVVYSVKRPGEQIRKPWLSFEYKHNFTGDTTTGKRPDYSINSSDAFFRPEWMVQQKSDIGSGASVFRKSFFVSNTNGEIAAYHSRNGKQRWTYSAGGKIYSIPTADKKIVVCGVANGSIIGINRKLGKKVWEIKADKAVLGHPVIKNGIAFIGSSDNTFRAIDIKTGNIKWQAESIEGFVVTKPLLHNGKVYFGTWGRKLYCLDEVTGKKIWQWDNGHGSRMYSPAAVWPKAIGDRLFIVAPDRYMTCLNAETGEVIWRKQDTTQRVRESMGISENGKRIYAKTMDGNVIGVNSEEGIMEIDWKGDYNLGYEIAPTAILEHGNTVYVPTQSGTIAAFDGNSGKLLGRYKISNSLITSIVVAGKKQIAATTMDGKIMVLKTKIKN